MMYDKMQNNMVLCWLEKAAPTRLAHCHYYRQTKAYIMDVFVTSYFAAKDLKVPYSGRNVTKPPSLEIYKDILKKRRDVKDRCILVVKMGWKRKKL